MALDEALLERAAEAGDFAALRTYGWSTPTLSIGYFQHLAELTEDVRWRTVPLVRRATGGGAIWHHHELTYSLVLPSLHPCARPHTGLYHSVHSAIAESPQPAGSRGQSPGRVSSSRSSRNRTTPAVPLLRRQGLGGPGLRCLQGRGQCAEAARGGDLAARFRAAETLADGRPNSQASATSSRSRRLRRSWADPIAAAIVRALGLLPTQAEEDDSIRRRAAELERTVYRDPAWTGRRP